MLSSFIFVSTILNFLIPCCEVGVGRDLVLLHLCAMNVQLIYTIPDITKKQQSHSLAQSVSYKHCNELCDLCVNIFSLSLILLSRWDLTLVCNLLSRSVIKSSYYTVCTFYNSLLFYIRLFIYFCKISNSHWLHMEMFIYVLPFNL